MFEDKKIHVKDSKINGDVVLGDKITHNYYNDSPDPAKDQDISSSKFENNKKQYYIDKWNDVLFLHRGEPEEKQVKLSDLYILPDYNYKYSKCDNLYDEIEHFIHSQVEYRVLFIMGQAGLGKSSLISYLASKENDYIYVRLRDLDAVDEVLSSVIGYLNCRKKDLENKTLVLDGFDEAIINSYSSMIVNSFLNSIWQIEGLKSIITSRLHYFNIDYKNVMMPGSKALNNIFKIEYFTVNISITTYDKL